MCHIPRGTSCRRLHPSSGIKVPRNTSRSSFLPRFSPGHVAHAIVPWPRPPQSAKTLATLRGCLVKYQGPPVTTAPWRSRPEGLQRFRPRGLHVELFFQGRPGRSRVEGPPPCDATLPMEWGPIPAVEPRLTESSYPQVSSPRHRFRATLQSFK